MNIAQDAVVSVDSSIKHLALESLVVPGVIVSRNNALARLADRSAHPFILGATELSIPSFAAATAALSRRLEGAPAGFADAATEAWLDAQDISLADASLAFEQLERSWQRQAEIKTFGEAVAAMMCWPIMDTAELPMTPSEWREFSQQASLDEMRERAHAMGIEPDWSPEHFQTREGHYHMRGA